jgi:metallo-beta-lactamase family protein
MKIAFHGAARTVTGSKHLLTLKNGKKILLDCGMFQGMGQDTDAFNRDFGFEPSEVDVMILSHAHIDHSGLIPKLVKDGFSGKIFCTSATRELTKILLEDSGEIQQSDVQYSNKRRLAEGQILLQPLYTLEDARRSFDSFAELQYGEWKQVIDGVEVLITDAGHIIGSGCVHLKINENGTVRRLTFSGDVGRYRDIILRSRKFFRKPILFCWNQLMETACIRCYTTPDHLLQWINKACLQKKENSLCPPLV